MKEDLQQYARLLLQEGVNLQQDQLLVINGDVELLNLVYRMSKMRSYLIPRLGLKICITISLIPTHVFYP